MRCARRLPAFSIVDPGTSGTCCSGTFRYQSCPDAHCRDPSGGTNGDSPVAQQKLWPELADVPATFVLHGGTGIALRLGHRASVDFDFFSSDPLDRRALAKIPFQASAQVLQEQPDALTVSIDRSGPVKVSFFGPVGFGRVGEPQVTSDGVLRVASSLDLSATKVKVLLQRIEAKDYFDIVALLRSGVALDEMLRAARALFGEAFNPLVAQKALAYFEGGDLASLDPSARELLVAASAREIDVAPMAKLSARLDGAR